MKKLICILWSMLSFMAMRGQNVGIGTPSPTEKLEVDGNIKVTNSNKGIILNTADAPIITRAWDPFTGGAYTGAGRWGLFMEPNRLTLGIPDLFGKHFSVASFDENSLVTKNMFTVNWEGAVGIGTDFPTGRFHIVDDSTLLVMHRDGRMGLNTTSSNAKLDIKGSDNTSSLLVRASNNNEIFKINSAIFNNAVEIGGFNPGAVGALNVSNRFISSTGNPQLRITAVNALGSGSVSSIHFDNPNSASGRHSIESFSGPDNLLHRFTLNHRNTSGINSLLFHFDENDLMGIGTNNPTQKLTVNGSINSSNLAGTGVRHVKADASGTLVTSMATGHLSIPAFSFVKKSPGSTDILTYSSGGVTGLTFPIGSTQAVVAPVYLPHGALIQNMKITYVDNSAQNIEVALYYNNTTSDGNYFISSFVSSSALSGIRNATDLITHTVNNTVNAYYIEIKPAAGMTWDTNKTEFKMLTIEYQY